MGTIRPLVRDDLAEVANLLIQAFKSKRNTASSALVSYLGDLFIDFPDRDPDIHSLVNVGTTGKISAFIGVLSQTMMYQGRPLRMAMANSFAADRSSQDPIG